MSWRWLSRILGRNLGLKAVSLALTTALYGVVVAGRTYERDISFTPILENVPQGYVVASDLPEVVVRMQATPRAFAALGDPARRAIRLTVTGEKQKEVRISESDIPLPRGVSVVSVQPERIQLRLDRVIRRTLPVRVAVRGNPAPGYDVIATRATPSSVQATGPDSYFATLTAIDTEPVDIEGLRESVTTRVGLNAAAQRMTLSPDAVEVRVSIDAQQATASVDDVPVDVVGPASLGARVESKTVTVRVRGPKALVEGLTARDLTAVVDAAEFSGRPAGRYVATRSVLNLPPEVEVQGISPRTVRLTLGGAPSTPPPP